MAAEPGTVTLALRRLTDGDPDAHGVIFELLYGELHRLASKLLRHESAGHTLQPTALINEAYLKLCGPGAVDYRDRTHFVAIAARAMRRLLVDHARRKNAKKRPKNRVELVDNIQGASDDPAQLIILDDALERLKLLDARQASIVEMRFFGGATEEEIAQHVGLSVRSVRREWRSARAWLYGELGGECDSHQGSSNSDKES